MNLTVPSMLGIHGIFQNRQTPQSLRDAWSAGLGASIGSYCRSTDTTVPIPACVVPHFSALLPRSMGQLDASVDLDLADTGIVELEFLTSALQDVFIDTTPEEFDKFAARGLALGGGLPATSKRLNRLLLAVDGRWPHASRAMVWVLHEVYLYLYEAEAALEVRRFICDEAPRETRIVIGHSLGSVIAYDLLRRGQLPQVHTFFAVGSPLGFPTVQKALARTMDNRTEPSDLRLHSWATIYDPRDAVTGGRGLNHAWPQTNDIPVENRRRNSHGIREYLGQASLGAAVCEALAISDI